MSLGQGTDNPTVEEGRRETGTTSGRQVGRGTEDYGSVSEGLPVKRENRVTILTLTRVRFRGWRRTRVSTTKEGTVDRLYSHKQIWGAGVVGEKGPTL